MMITARVAKEEGIWGSAHCDIAGVFTAGKSRRDALAMLADAFESLVNRPGFKVTVTELGGDGAVLVEANDPAPLFAIVLRYQREMHGFSLADVARKLGASSRNAYARYEQGTTVPRLDTLLQMLQAVAPRLALAFVQRSPAPHSSGVKKRTRSAR
jgi:hypothetical protein